MEPANASIPAAPVAALLSRAETFTWRGRQWTLPYPDVGTELAYAKFLKDAALREVLSRRGTMLREQDYREAHGAWQRDCAAFRYAWGMAVAEESLTHKDGFCEALALMLTQVPEQRSLTRQDVADLYAERKADLVEMFNRLMAADPTTPSAS